MLDNLMNARFFGLIHRVRLGGRRLLSAAWAWKQRLGGCCLAGSGHQVQPQPTTS